MTVPGDGGNDADTSCPVGTGAVTGNVIDELKIAVDHAIDSADDVGTLNVPYYPETSQKRPPRAPP